MSLSEIPLTPDQTAPLATQLVRPAVRGRARVSALRPGSAGPVVTTIVVIIALLWSIPTFGLFVASFRPANLITTTGWWTGLVPPWHFTIQNYANVIQTFAK